LLDYINWLSKCLNCPTEIISCSLSLANPRRTSRWLRFNS